MIEEVAHVATLTLAELSADGAVTAAGRAGEGGRKVVANVAGQARRRVALKTLGRTGRARTALRVVALQAGDAIGAGEAVDAVLNVSAVVASHPAEIEADSAGETARRGGAGGAGRTAGQAVGGVRIEAHCASEAAGARVAGFAHRRAGRTG